MVCTGRRPDCITCVPMASQPGPIVVTSYCQSPHNQTLWSPINISITILQIFNYSPTHDVQPITMVMWVIFLAFICPYLAKWQVSIVAMTGSHCAVPLILILSYTLLYAWLLEYFLLPSFDMTKYWIDVWSHTHAYSSIGTRDGVLHCCHGNNKNHAIVSN